MKRVLYLFAALITIVSCANEEVTIVIPVSDEFYCSIENKESTRTLLDQNNNVIWSSEDQLVIFKKSSIPSKYQISESHVGKTSGSFYKVNSDEFNAGSELDHNVALYPYQENIEITKLDSDSPTSSYKITGYNFPVEQTYVENSFANGAFPMAAVSDNYDLTFKNICGGIKLQLKGTQKITSIKIEGKNSEKLAGNAEVVVYSNENLKPTITMASNAKTSVILNCGAGVQLNKNNATEFIITLPPVMFTKGFAITIAFSDDNQQVIETSKENSILRSSLLHMPEMTLDASENQPDMPEGEYVDLSQSVTANCYIVSQNGKYKFSSVMGNSSKSVSSVVSADVLWESFGTDVTPNIGDLVKNIVYSDGYIMFQTADTFREGNAVIAARDAYGNILWSWHIWLTDQPQGQVYYNNAGTMLDRNLGATSATPGDVGALGLLYQWGRKDPFLGSSSISSSTPAKSTITFPSALEMNSPNGTIEYATTHPTTFITCNMYNSDWYYTGSKSTDNTRWTTSDKTKSIYDPCPAGWRVPDGGYNGVWSKAGFHDNTYDSSKKGMSFSISSHSTTWYPALGCRYGESGILDGVGIGGIYWSASPYDKYAYTLYFLYDGAVDPLKHNNRASGHSVRCVKE